MADENTNTQNIDLFGLFPGRSDLRRGSTSVSVERKKTYENCDARKDNFVQQQGTLFECSICMDLAKDPVVTCCGHLFCWPCLYRWLNHRSGANQCPVCKGEVTTKNVTPIYGHDGNINNNTEMDNGTENIPLRPQARRNESAWHDFPLIDFR